MKALLDGIYAKLAANANLTGQVGTRIYVEEAPEVTTYPYITFHLISLIKDKTFAKSGVYRARIQFDIWSKPTNRGYTESDTIRGYLDTAIDEVALTITGHTHIGTTFYGGMGPQQEEDVWHQILEYLVWYETA